jgi:hypothetical protein
MPGTLLDTVNTAWSYIALENLELSQRPQKPTDTVSVYGYKLINEEENSLWKIFRVYPKFVSVYLQEHLAIG